jgi:hypothetical protein
VRTHNFNIGQVHIQPYNQNYLSLHLSIYLTPQTRVLPEKLTGAQLLKKFSRFEETRRFVTTFMTAHHLSLSRDIEE